MVQRLWVKGISGVRASGFMASRGSEPWCGRALGCPDLPMQFLFESYSIIPYPKTRNKPQKELHRSPWVLLKLRRE